MLRAAVLILLAWAAWAAQAAQPAHGAPPRPPLKSIVMVGFELVDDTYDRSEPETRRLALIGERLRAEFAQRGFYTVVDPSPAAAFIESLRQSQALHACNGCAEEIGKRLGAERVLVGWVQKVSRLILNINIQIIDVGSGATVLGKSVDLRGNTDESWNRGILHLVRDMAEKGQGNR